MNTPRYVAAMRSYKWNDDIAALAERFFANCPGARHIVLMNEATGPVDCRPFEKLAHTEDFTDYGLPERPVGRSLWYNGDYAYIHLRTAFPDYDHYIVTEADAAVNLSLEPMVRQVAERGIDAVMHWCQPVDPGWYWHAQSLAQEDPWQAALFLAVFSGRAIDAMLEERRSLTRRFAYGDIEHWPIIESFVPTTLRARGFRFVELGEFADTSVLRHRPFLSRRDPDAMRPGSIAHPVVGGADLIGRYGAELPVQDFLDPESAAGRALACEPLDALAVPLWDALIGHGDHAGVDRLHAMMIHRGLTFPHRHDLALGKPANQSSVSEWSRGLNARLDAAGANGIGLHAQCAFHTGSETDAWWTVDLLDDCLIDRVSIINRVGSGERFRHFVVESARDATHWLIRHLKTDDEPVSDDSERPWSIAFDTPFLARHVRIRRIGAPDYLHLRRVQVFGRLATDVAAP